MEKDNWMKNLTNTTVKKQRKNCSLTNRRVKKEKKGAAAQLIGRKGKNDQLQEAPKQNKVLVKKAKKELFCASTQKYSSTRKGSN